MRHGLTWTFGLGLLAIVAATLFWLNRAAEPAHSPLRIAMAPYQDLAMIVNAEPLGLEKKYGTDIELITMGWEDISPAVASAGRAADIGFASYTEYLTKYEKLNDGSSDPVLFIFPLYAFKGGAFVTFDPNMPRLDREAISQPGSPAVRQVLSGRLGAQKASVYEMMLHDLATRQGMDPTKLRIIDTPLDQGFLAAENGDLDIAEAGLTQLTEAGRRGGRLVFNMEDLGFADITGFIVKKSVYDSRRKDVENVIRMWFDSVDYVYRDIDTNSAVSLAYLNKNASTRYTLAEYKAALSQEYLPQSVAQAKSTFVVTDAPFSATRIGTSVNRYLVRMGVIKTPTPLPLFSDVD
ncbi:MAG: hypothetical protein JWR84_1723 [Caulobacter sp.]|nr:hypothetical protein [Caulobacter sp.]